MSVDGNNEYLVENKSWDWLQYGRSFSVTARICCDKLLSGEEISGFDPKYLRIAVIYNIKHALEVYLKMIQLLLGQSILHDHNLNVIFSQVKQGVKDIDGKVRIFLEEPKNSPESELGKKYLDTWKNGWGKVGKVIEYYHYLKFLDNKVLNKQDIDDFKNVIFKYPDDRLWQNNKLGIVLTKIIKKDIKRFKEDIIEISDLFTEILLILLFFNHVNKGEPI